MKTLQKAAIEFVTIGILGIVVAFSVNAIRAKGSIKPSKNYFDKGDDLIRAKRANLDQDKSVKNPIPVAPKTGAPPVTAPVQQAGTKTDAPAVKEVEGGQHPKHPYQEIDFEGVMAVLKDPNTASGLNVIVDARKDEQFEEGHIPGAVVCNPHEIDLYLDSIRPAVMGAEKVIVYCGGGDCEDSVAMCRELIEMDVPYEAVYLFAGGWNDWAARNGPTGTGKQ